MPTTNHATSSGNWSSNSIWSLGAPPSATQIIQIDSGASVDVTTQVTMNGSTITVNGSITIEPTGSFVGPNGDVTLNPGGIVTVAGGALTDGGLMKILGGALVVSAGTVVIGPGTTYLDLRSGNVTVSGGNVTFDAGPPSTITGGTLIISGGSVAFVSGLTLYSGGVTISGGEFAVNATPVTLAGGTIAVASGATFAFSTDFNAASSVSIWGTQLTFASGAIVKNYLPDHAGGWGVQMMPGSGATASASVGGGQLSSIAVTADGSGYTTAPPVVITGGGGNGASATATINGSGQVSSIAVNNHGSGYTSPPTITIPSAGSAYFSAFGDVLTYINEFDAMPAGFSLLSVSALPNCSVTGKLGHVEFLMQDGSGNLADSTQLPAVFVYKNGVIWDGPVSVTYSPLYNPGQFFVDVDFTNTGPNAGSWSAGDHGSIKACWQIGGAWYSRVYYWLVDRLGYEAYTAAQDASSAAQDALSATQAQLANTSPRWISLSNAAGSVVENIPLMPTLYAGKPWWNDGLMYVRWNAGNSWWDLNGNLVFGTGHSTTLFAAYTVSGADYGSPVTVSPASEINPASIFTIQAGLATSTQASTIDGRLTNGTSGLAAIQTGVSGVAASMATASGQASILAAVTADPAGVISALIAEGVLQYVSGTSGPLQFTRTALQKGGGGNADASQFTGSFPASVLANAPTGPTYNLSGVTPIGGLMPLPLVIQQYCSIALRIPLAAAVAGDTLTFVVTSMADRTTVLWQYAATLSEDGRTAIVDEDDINTQAPPPNGWYWYLVDSTTKLRVGEGPLTMDAGPLVI